MIIDMNTSFVFINIFLTQIYLHKSPYNPLNFEKGQKRIIFFFGMQHNNFSAAINFQKKKKFVIWLYSLAEILHRHPEGNIALVEIQWLPPFHGIFQNLKKNQIYIEIY